MGSPEDVRAEVYEGIHTIGPGGGYMVASSDALREAGLREKVKVIVGGAPLTQAFADEIGVDGYAYDAPEAAQKCSELLSE